MSEEVLPPPPIPQEDIKPLPPPSEKPDLPPSPPTGGEDAPQPNGKDLPPTDTLPPPPDSLPPPPPPTTTDTPPNDTPIPPPADLPPPSDIPPAIPTDLPPPTSDLPPPPSDLPPPPPREYSEEERNAAAVRIQKSWKKYKETHKKKSGWADAPVATTARLVTPSKARVTRVGRKPPTRGKKVESKPQSVPDREMDLSSPPEGSEDSEEKEKTPVKPAGARPGMMGGMPMFNPSAVQLKASAKPAPKKEDKEPTAPFPMVKLKSAPSRPADMNGENKPPNSNKQFPAHSSMIDVSRVGKNKPPVSDRQAKAASVMVPTSPKFEEEPAAAPIPPPLVIEEDKPDAGSSSSTPPTTTPPPPETTTTTTTTPTPTPTPKKEKKGLAGFFSRLFGGGKKKSKK